ncbi:MAG: glycosyltransferase family 4 protein [Salinivirgaceae bacterium]|nr:glycosyltransferase family 4 protein [Salinivirgaceae bacterium]
MLKIGFDAKRLFNNFTGLGNYSRSLVSGIKKYHPENELFLFTPKIQKKEDTKPFFENTYNIITPKSGSKNLWRTSKCIKDIKQNELDIYHGLSHELPIGIKNTKSKSLVTIHDLIYKTYPNDFSLIDRKIYDFKFRFACKHADKIIAVSNSTKQDLIKHYHLNPEKIAVCYQTCHDMFKVELNQDTLDSFLDHYNLPKEYMLYVGSIIERKNLLGIVQAIEKYKHKINIPLIVVGKGGKYLQQVKKYISDKNIENNILFLNPLNYLHLPALYQKAKLFLYPSQYEGFGIPIIEALWSKTPVITTKSSSLPEAAGDGAYYCDPNSIDSIAAGIIKILNDESYANKLVSDGLNHIQQFSSERTTLELMKVYNELVS